VARQINQQSTGIYPLFRDCQIKQSFSFQCQLTGTSEVNVSQLSECHQSTAAWTASQRESFRESPIATLRTKRLEGSQHGTPGTRSPRLGSLVPPAVYFFRMNPSLRQLLCYLETSLFAG